MILLGEVIKKHSMSVTTIFCVNVYALYRACPLHLDIKQSVSDDGNDAGGDDRNDHRPEF